MKPLVLRSVAAKGEAPWLLVWLAQRSVGVKELRCKKKLVERGVKLEYPVI